MPVDDRQDKELLHLTQRVMNLENELRTLDKLSRNNTHEINVLKEARTRQIELNKQFLDDRKPTEETPEENKKSSWLDIFKNFN